MRIVLGVLNRARPLQAFGRRDGRNLPADDGRPIGNQRGGGKPVFLEGFARQAWHETADRLDPEQSVRPLASEADGRARRDMRCGTIAGVGSQAASPVAGIQ